MSIHYRVLKNGQPVTVKVFRSVKVARKATTDGCKLFAFSSRQDALNLAELRLEVKATHQAPTTLTQDQINSFIDSHHQAKRLNPQYPPRHASSRRQLESKYQSALFGFFNGLAIHAAQSMDVSCSWIKYSCPIYIDGQKRTIKTLETASK